MQLYDPAPHPLYKLSLPTLMLQQNVLNYVVVIATISRGDNELQKSIDILLAHTKSNNKK